MKICFVSAFPPSERMLNEYALHMVKALSDQPGLSVTILADQLDEALPELPGFDVVRTWRFNDITNPWRILKAVREIKPDVVWFNLLFATFGNQLNPAAAFTGLFTPALVRAAGFYTHITLHHLMDHIDLGHANVKNPRVYRMAGWTATKVLLMANSSTVLLPVYRKTLVEKYRGQNVHFSPHGIFSARPEMLMEAFPSIAERIRNVKLTIAGADHPVMPGYMKSIEEKYGSDPRIEFAGYVAEEDIPELFKTTSLLVMPYSSSTGASGVAHQAAEYGVPIVCADIPDFREMAEYEGLAIQFYPVNNTQAFGEAVVEMLSNPEMLSEMCEKNYNAALRMTMPNIVRNYLRIFQKNQFVKTLKKQSRARELPAWAPTRSSAFVSPSKKKIGA
jgi:glycosyltransferase involved in cell wall biosynthesis